MPYKDPAKRREQARRAHAKNPEIKRRYQRKVGAAAQKAWVARHPEKRRAQNIVGGHLARGSLKRGPCEREGATCRGRVHAHHDDYSKPLEVRWLCALHHREVHRRLAEQRIA